MEEHSGLQQNATGHDDLAADLPPDQGQALTALAGGATVTAAAEAAGRDRTTVHRWLREDLAFQAAHNRLRRDLRREATVQLDQIVHRALETVRSAVDSGDVRTAQAVLKGTGLLPGTRSFIGRDDVAELREEADVQAEERASSRLWRRLGAT